jgi:ABC-type multidrug transport system ATPase subunit
LLDILAGRLVSNNLTGEILANGKPVDFRSFRKQSGYVMQSDALFPLLTVKETLFYAAHLRIIGKTYAEREAQALSTMQLLRLEGVQNTIVGDELNRGLSGGEKRRVSIAVDIIHEPRVIFLDEPTSGTYYG